jgi:hypothetical protein
MKPTEASATPAVKGRRGSPATDAAALSRLRSRPSPQRAAASHRKPVVAANRRPCHTHPAIAGEGERSGAASHPIPSLAAIEALPKQQHRACEHAGPARIDPTRGKLKCPCPAASGTGTARQRWACGAGRAGNADRANDQGSAAQRAECADGREARSQGTGRQSTRRQSAACCTRGAARASNDHKPSLARRAGTATGRPDRRPVENAHRRLYAVTVSGRRTPGSVVRESGGSADAAANADGEQRPTRTTEPRG